MKKIKDLPEKQQKWLESFGFNLDSKISKSQLSPPYLNEANYGTPIWDYTPLQLAVAESETAHVTALIENGALGEDRPLAASGKANYLYVIALRIDSPGSRVTMVEHLMQYIPISKNIIDIANEQLGEGVLEKFGNYVFTFFNGINADRRANNDILKMLDESYHQQTKLKKEM